MTSIWRDKLQRGVVIPAHPLALDANRRMDERRQRALTRYYLAAGAGGVAVGVHTTQFEIRDPKFGLYQPVLTLQWKNCAPPMPSASPELLARRHKPLKKRNSPPAAGITQGC